VLYSVYNDGQYPTGYLIAAKGTLYGTTSGDYSGDCGHVQRDNCGTVFSITTNGAEKVLHSFSGSAPQLAVARTGTERSSRSHRKRRAVNGMRFAGLFFEPRLTYRAASGKRGPSI
jgi:hypothetical protein